MGVVVLYAVGINEAAQSGEIEKMKAMAAQAEKHLEEHGDVAGALENLKAAIAKIEGK